MLRLLALVLALALPAAAAQSAESTFLAGDWGEVPETGDVPCGFPNGHGEQIAFEFARTGGRALIFEAADLFTAIGGLQVRSEGDVLILTARTRSGETKPMTRLKRTGPDSFEMMARDGKPGPKWRRCPAVENPVASDVSDANLFALTPAISGAQGFPEFWPGEMPADICEGKAAPDTFQHRRHGLQFELIGPTHYWTMSDMDQIPDFSSVRSARQVAADTLHLALYNWAHGATVEFDVRIAADHIDIPQLGASFARCRPDQDTSLGMHRM